MKIYNFNEIMLYSPIDEDKTNGGLIENDNQINNNILGDNVTTNTDEIILGAGDCALDYGFITCPENTCNNDTTGCAPVGMECNPKTCITDGNSCGRDIDLSGGTTIKTYYYDFVVFSFTGLPTTGTSSGYAYPVTPKLITIQQADGWNTAYYNYISYNGQDKTSLKAYDKYFYAIIKESATTSFVEEHDTSIFNGTTMTLYVPGHNSKSFTITSVNTFSTTSKNNYGPSLTEIELGINLMIDQSNVTINKVNLKTNHFKIYTNSMVANSIYAPNILAYNGTTFNFYEKTLYEGGAGYYKSQQNYYDRRFFDDQLITDEYYGHNQGYLYTMKSSTSEDKVTHRCSWDIYTPFRYLSILPKRAGMENYAIDFDYTMLSGYTTPYANTYTGNTYYFKNFSLDLIKMGTNATSPLNKLEIKKNNKVLTASDVRQMFPGVNLTENPYYWDLQIEDVGSNNGICLDYLNCYITDTSGGKGFYYSGSTTIGGKYPKLNASNLVSFAYNSGSINNVTNNFGGMTAKNIYVINPNMTFLWQ